MQKSANSSRMSNYTVYIHTNRANGFKYVGITSKKPESRWQSGHGYRKQTVFWNAIVKYGWDNFDHEIIASNVSAEKAWELEQELIAEYNTTDRNHGYNRSIGGEAGAKGVERSEKNKAACSKMLKQKWSDPEFRARKIAQTIERKRSQEMREKRSLSGKGRRCSQETREKISAAQKGHKRKPFTEEHRRHLSENHKGGAKKKPVMCVETGIVYSCIKDAAKETGINKKQISCCCRGDLHYNTAGGYTWQYAEVI